MVVSLFFSLPQSSAFCTQEHPWQIRKRRRRSLHPFFVRNDSASEGENLSFPADFWQKPLKFILLPRKKIIFRNTANFGHAHRHRNSLFLLRS